MVARTFFLSRATNLSPAKLNITALNIIAVQPTTKTTTKYNTSRFIRPIIYTIMISTGTYTSY